MQNTKNALQKGDLSIVFVPPQGTDISRWIRGVSADGSQCPRMLPYWYIFVAERAGMHRTASGRKQMRKGISAVIG